MEAAYNNHLSAPNSPTSLQVARYAKARRPTQRKRCLGQVTTDLFSTLYVACIFDQARRALHPQIPIALRRNGLAPAQVLS